VRVRSTVPTEIRWCPSAADRRIELAFEVGIILAFKRSANLSETHEQFAPESVNASVCKLLTRRWMKVSCSIFCVTRFRFR